MKVHTIFTGGTIASCLNEQQKISTYSESGYELLNRYKETNCYRELCKTEDKIVITTSAPYQILSENLDAEHLNRLIEEVRLVWAEQADSNPKESALSGIIITHGTDTIQYTAAILGYLFADISIPIVLVSSAYILSDPRANGVDNFAFAMDFIANKRGMGVFVCYKNTDGVTYIHRGTRMDLPRTLSPDMDSVNAKWFARYTGETSSYQVNSDYYVLPGGHSDDTNGKKSEPQHTQQNVVPTLSCRKLTENSQAILRIRPYVGMTYPVLSVETKAILFESYHSGTINVNGQFQTFMKEVNERRIPAFLVGLSQTEMEYETVEVYKQYGLIPLPESAVIAQYCKLWIAISGGQEQNLQAVMLGAVAEDHLAHS